MSLSCIHFLSVLHCYSNVPCGPLRWYFDTSEFCPSWPATTVSSLEVCLGSGLLEWDFMQDDSPGRDSCQKHSFATGYIIGISIYLQTEVSTPWSLSKSSSVPIIPVCTRQQPGLDNHGQRTRRLPPRQPFQPLQSFRPFTRFTIEIARVTGSEKFLTILNN